MKSKNAQIRLTLNRSERFQLEVELDNISNGITAIFGESGCGKTTLLRCIAGLEKADGLVKIRDETWQGGNVFLPTHRRSIGYVFQQANLFPHLTVLGNLNYARRRAKKQIAESRFNQLIETTQIRVLLNSNVSELSGGEAQRVAIVRALVMEPDILLMDEPLASLDESRKESILSYLDVLKEELSIPILYVTHSLKEVARIADNVILLKAGRVVQQGTVTDLFASIKADAYLGKEAGVVLEGKIASIDPEWQLANFQFAGGVLKIHRRGLEEKQSARVRILAKDVSLSLSHHNDSSFLNQLYVEVFAVKDAENQDYVTLKLKVGESFLLTHITQYSFSRLNIVEGMGVWANVKAVAII